MKNKNGFTIIELSISMAFVSILLISIVMLTVSMTGIYQRGLTLRYMDQKGRELTDLISRDIRATRNSGSINGSIFTQTVGTGTSAKTYDVGGVFCTATSRYIWLNKYPLGEGAMIVPVRQTTAEEYAPEFRLIRISDTDRTNDPYCGFNNGTKPSRSDIMFTRPDGSTVPTLGVKISSAALTDIETKGTELLPKGTNAVLAIQTIKILQSSAGGDLHCPSGATWNSSLNVCVDVSGDTVCPIGSTPSGSRCVDNTTHTVVTEVRMQSNYVPMLLVLTTLRGNTRTTLTGDGKCDISNTATANYCALNKFEFSARVGQGSNTEEIWNSPN